MSISSNPFDDVYNALWKCVATSREMTEIIKPGNRIRFDDKQNPIKPDIASADLPELVLSAEGVAAVNLHRTSCHTSITRRYSWLLSTGDLRLNHTFNRVEWQLFCAMVNYKACIGNLIWRDKPYVVGSRVLDAVAGISDPKQNRGIQGWSSIWRCEVEMHFATVDLIGELA